MSAGQDIGPMAGSVAAEARRRLTPDLRSICVALDAEVERLKGLPPAVSDDIERYRNGMRDGLRLALHRIERGQVSA